MINIYIRWIKLGNITIEDVPARWLNSVAEKLGLAGNDDSGESTGVN